MPAQDKSVLSDIKLNGLFSGSYTYNFSKPPDNKNKFRVFDFNHNSFNIDVFELSFRKDVSVERDAGFRFDLTTGSSIPWVSKSSSLTSGDVDIQQIFVSFIAPLGNGIKFDIGKFVTPFGLEVIEGYDGYNDNYSRSFNFGYSIPFTHTGIKTSYCLSDEYSIGLFLVNGWDNSVDNNNSKSLGAQFILSPLNGLSIIPGVMYGPEKNNNNIDPRILFDLVSTYSFSESVTLGLNFDYGNESFKSDNNNSAEWFGLAVYFKYKFNDSYSVALRAEQFNDRDGNRTGIVQNLTGITLTPSLDLKKNLIFRSDFRYDISNVDVFKNKSSQPKPSQLTIAFNVIYVF
jgi:hypothetical protein